MLSFFLGFDLSCLADPWFVGPALLKTGAGSVSGVFVCLSNFMKWHGWTLCTFSLFLFL